jgi:predicted transcriptional regulator
MKYTERFMKSVNQGLSEINAGDFLDTEELKSELKKRRLARKPV